MNVNPKPSKPKPTPKPGDTEAVRLAKAKRDAYAGHLKRESKKESTVQMLKRVLTLGASEGIKPDLEMQKLNTYQQNVDQAIKNARSTAGDNSNVNPVNGPIAGSHKKEGK